MHPKAAQSLLNHRSAPWGRFLFISLGAHVLAIGVLAAAQAWAGGPKIDLNTQPIEASLVRLGKPRDPKMLPRLEAATPTPPTPAPPAPQEEAPPPPTPAAVPTVMPSPHTPPAPDTAKPAARRAQLFGAFSKFARNAPPAELEGAADGDVNGDSAKQEGERYYGMIEVQVHRHYDVSDTIPDDERIRLRAQVVLKLSRSGEVVKSELVHSSGNALFDSAVLVAVKKASPFPPPPDALRERLHREGVVLEFRP
jgi:TonB family protein